jgi:DNA-nicking Smr family endonuclease
MARVPREERELWHRATRDVAPLAGRPRQHPVERPRSATERPESGPFVRGNTGPKSVKVTAESPPIDSFAGVDRATADRVKRGRYEIEARLDLHGMTQEEAHRALRSFVLSSRTVGRRCVLVITGHGRLSGGVLKTAVPRWLAEPELRHHVLGIAPARPPHGGSGALYLLLRRPPA